MAKKRKIRGFASIPKEEHLSIASRGGQNAAATGRTHKWDSASAKRAALARHHPQLH